MSSTSLIQFRNGIAEDAVEYRNSFGGAARIWDAIWNKYGTPKHEYDNWMSAATDGRLWELWKTAGFSESEKLVYLFTCDNALVAKEDFAKLATALREFASSYPATGVCHLRAWADFIEASTAEAIGLYATTVTENPWFAWDEEKDESAPYDIAKGDKHWWIGELMKESSEEDNDVTTKAATRIDFEDKPNHVSEHSVHRFVIEREEFTNEVPMEPGCYWVYIQEYCERNSEGLIDIFPVFFDGQNVMYFANCVQVKECAKGIVVTELDKLTIDDVVVPVEFAKLRWGKKIAWSPAGSFAPQDR